MRAHIDQTPRSGELRLRKHFPSAAEGVRVQIVNVWRPINGTVVSNPLALAESQSVDEEDLVPVRHIYEDYEGETAAVRYASTQRWGYLAGHTGDEVTLILCLDTKGGRRVPHTAFVHPLQQEGAKGRESIEVRCLVVGGDKGLGV